VAAVVPHKLSLDKLAPTERAVLDLAGDGASIGEIIRDFEQGRGAAFRSCFALLSVGLLEPVPDDVPPRDPATEPHAELIQAQFDRLESISDEDLLGIRKSVDKEELQTSYEELRSEWNQMRDETEAPALLHKIDAITFRLAAAYSQLLAERQRIDLEEPEATPEPEALLEPEATPEPVTPPTDPMRDRKIEQLERDARLHLQVRDWSGGLSLLHELVALAPQSASYQEMLAQALQHHPRLSKNAEQHFLEAVALAPEDAEIRLSLARYYLLTDKRSRAIAEIQFALGLDPKNQEAHRLLEGTKQPTRMQKLVKRIFG
jgi:tetratricopeptide (TPR) repeat protein